MGRFFIEGQDQELPASQLHKIDLKMYFYSQLFSVVILLISCICAAPPAKLPPSFQKCQLGETFDSCVERAIEKAVKSIAKGYQPLGILPIDPLRINSMAIQQGDGPVSINLKFKNIDMGGVSNVQVKSFRSDFNKLTFNVKANTPKVTLRGPYSIDGKVLILPIKGDGQADITLENPTVDIKIIGKKHEKEGNTYMKIVEFDVKVPDSEKLTISLSNLFNGDKILGDNMNKFLNENSKDIFNELRPAVESAFSAAFREITNRIFTKVPFEEIFGKV